SGSTGSGRGVVGLRVEATSGPARTGTLTVAGRTVTVTQSPGCTFSINPASLNVGASGGTNTIQVQTAAECAWSSATGATWITVTSGTSVSGPGQAQLAVAANTGPARTGSVTLAGQTIHVAQASGCTYTVSPSTQDVAGTGGAGAASITTAAGCGWTAKAAVEWITV